MTDADANENDYLKAINESSGLKKEGPNTALKEEGSSLTNYISIIYSPHRP